ncbi:hypothetical protein CSX00_04920 [Pseudobutyrivibrio ruminis]|uniref:Uncharacterized protein n=1 Tax=Pseudobutyrivibrio ruminis TaxID=46206 RepID=A0A2G3ECC3_9FIRM|nr:hypothetical protein CSX00_04920 [Pseudobutyrivibrio ruminis]
MNFLDKSDFKRSKILYASLLFLLLLLPFRDNAIVKYSLLVDIICLFLNAVYIIFKWIKYLKNNK